MAAAELVVAALAAVVQGEAATAVGAQAVVATVAVGRVVVVLEVAETEEEAMV
jgi:hypothetical protein